MRYDITSPESIEQHAKLLIGRTLRDILPSDYSKYGGKGNIGQLIEKYHFDYEPNSDKEPDFSEAGVELKVTGYKKLKSGNNYSAKERLSLSIIDFMEIVNESFETSSFLKKNKLLLLIFYLYEYGNIDNIDFSIDFAQLFQYPDVDYEIIKNDWNTIVNKIRDGKAHELSEGDTMYLGAATKGSTSEKSKRHQPFSDIKAPQRAFSLKNKYMTHILRKYILNEKATYESIVKSPSDLQNTTFEQLILNKLKPYYGKTKLELAQQFDLNENAKDITSKIAFRILGVKTDNASEFEKANIVVKSIRLEQNGTIEQHMSFPTFKFKELITENWNDSTLRTTFSETKFLFVVYQFDEHRNLYLKKSFFWNMPLSILDSEIKNVWIKTVNTLKTGVILRKSGKRTFNNLPSPSENFYSHVRPHATKASYEAYCPYADELPDGRWMTKQCFWLNREYILQIINDSK